MTRNAKQLKSHHIFGKIVRDRINQVKCESHSLQVFLSTFFPYSLVTCSLSTWMTIATSQIRPVSRRRNLPNRALAATNGSLFVPRTQSCNAHVMLFVICKQERHCSTRESPPNIAPYRYHSRSMCRLRVWFTLAFRQCAIRRIVPYAITSLIYFRANRQCP